MCLQIKILITINWLMYINFLAPAHLWNNVSYLTLTLMYRALTNYDVRYVIRIWASILRWHIYVLYVFKCPFFKDIYIYAIRNKKVKDYMIDDWWLIIKNTWSFQIIFLLIRSRTNIKKFLISQKKREKERTFTTKYLRKWSLIEKLIPMKS